jgi:hypothetical protein
VSIFEDVDETEINSNMFKMAPNIKSIKQRKPCTAIGTKKLSIEEYGPYIDINPTTQGSFENISSSQLLGNIIRAQSGKQPRIKINQKSALNIHENIRDDTPDNSGV